MTSIEFIGASFDTFPYPESNHSEERFNDALKKLFPKKYIKYSNKNSTFYFYQYLRCGLVHQLRPLKPEIRLTTRDEALVDGNSHLEEKNGNVYLVLEDFYDDLEKAVNKLFLLQEKGKTPSSKLKSNFIQINKSDSGTTFN